MKDLFQYTIQQQPIGEGAYGEVYKGVCSQTGETIALKKTRIENMNDGILSTTMREISILTELEAHNVLINYSCRQGHCGSCILKLVDGEVLHQECLVPLSEGEILACQSKPTTDIKITKKD